MHLLLLSGGSGKRLWPLSNEVRSKQFLQLLESPTGKKESMIQRVVRQIKESGLADNITIATNSVQKDYIVNQLGTGVDIVTEPERRDTFPAIALAASYLISEKKCNDDEVVVVMPCDVFTEDGYFEVINKIGDCVNKNIAEMVLMGIRPTYPSEKFGYIVPETGSSQSTYYNVNSFTEKPSEEKAKALLSQGAFWNGGVFGFKLGYLSDILKKYTNALDFQYLRSHYSELPKISFDYEVVEKASSIAVVPYSGLWKDLGTWNALCSELPGYKKGNVEMGNNNVDTHVINELSIPIFCEGIDSAVVVASHDGIMVCAKKYSENIKDYANRLTTSPMYKEYCWGNSVVLDCEVRDGKTIAVVEKLCIKAGCTTTRLIDKNQRIILTVHSGKGFLQIGEDGIDLSIGDTFTINANKYYTIKAITDITIVFVYAE